MVAGMIGIMKCSRFWRLLLLVMICVNYGQAQGPTVSENKSSADAPNVLDTLRKIDQLVEQNQMLEKQNQELVDQIKSLREALAKQAVLVPTKPSTDHGNSGNMDSNTGATNGGSETLANGSAVNNSARLAIQSPTSSTTGQPPSASGQAAGAPSAQATAGGKSNQANQTGQSSATGKVDDKTEFPQASDGIPAIFGEFNPGRGFTVGRGKYGELNLSGYMVARYLNQFPGDQSGIDHLGRPIAVEPRNDFQFHRVMLFSQGWLFSPKFLYSTFVWTVQDTNQVAVGGALYYNFGKYMTLGGGWNAYPGTMSLQGSHPYWESYDRVMADEFFRPYFSQGVFAKGNLLPRLEYRWMIGNNNSNLDVPATKLDRELSGGAALTWLPTTGEFGPRGAFGDYENHQNLATRFNLAYTYSPEDRQAPIGTPAGNTTLRLADSLNIFDPGALANGVTVERTRYQLVSACAGIKYHGFWLQGEGYGRLLDEFVADGKLPVGAVRDYGFYVQAADMIVKKRFELYGATSYVFGQYGDPKEFIVGGNYYPWNTRNIRLNAQLINVDRSPVSSTFGFYVGQLTGHVFSFGLTTLY